MVEEVTASYSHFTNCTMKNQTEVHGVTSYINNTNISYLKYHDYHQSWNHKARMYSLIISVIFGCPANMLSFLVFMKSKLRLSPTGTYLMAIAWIDSLVLILEVLTRTNVVAVSATSCKVAYYLRFSFKFLEASLVVSLCISRTLCLIFPFSNYKCSKKSTATLCIFLETLAAFTLCTYALVHTIKYGQGCNTDWRSPNKLIYFIADTVISVAIGEILSSLIVILLAIYIMKSLRTYRKNSQSIRHEHKERKDKNLDKQITRMTAAVAVTFTCFRLPYSVLYIIFDIRNHFYRMSYQSQKNLIIAVDVAAIFCTLNYCTNFFIYITLWRAFRNKCWKIFTCRKQEERSNFRKFSGSSRRGTEITNFICSD